MNFFNQLIPDYLLTKRNQIWMLSFVSVFAFLFINVFKPFRSVEWLNLGEKPLKYMGLSFLLVLQGTLIVSISRTCMYLYTRRHLISYGQYIAWVFAELFVLAASFTIWSIMFGLQEYFFIALKSALENTALLLFIPYTLCIIYFSLKEKEQLLKKLQEDTNTHPVGDDTSTKPMITFYDGRGALLLSVARENCLYIEASDNYVCLWYLKNEMPRKAMIRLTMSRVVEQLKNTNIVRCHRSFMVNLEKIRMVRRDKEGLFLEMGIPSVKEIPVSKTYGDSVMKWILNNG